MVFETKSCVMFARTSKVMKTEKHLLQKYISTFIKVIIMISNFYKTINSVTNNLKL